MAFLSESRRALRGGPDSPPDSRCPRAWRGLALGDRPSYREQPQERRFHPLEARRPRIVRPQREHGGPETPCDVVPRPRANDRVRGTYR